VRRLSPNSAVPALDAARTVIVVLGCRAVVDPSGRLAPGALARRVDAASRLYLDLAGLDRTPRDPAMLVVASGGRRWGNVVEADAMAHELRLRGVPEGAIVRERCSLTTRDNARFVAEALARNGSRAALVVTCSWHMPRALALFTRAGMEVEPFPASAEEGGSRRHRVWRWVREGFLTWVQRT
jgi:uncharacterized SAM-binding protein YcdF (DUF218 family)